MSDKSAIPQDGISSDNKEMRGRRAMTTEWRNRS
jgi:hypothetical protein